MIHVVSLLNADGLELIVTNLVKNFVGFAPLGTVLVAIVGCCYCRVLWFAICSYAWLGHGRIVIAW